MQKFFITGTDTHVGKTYVTQLLLNFFNQKGKKTLGLKPIASGAQVKNGKWYNEDALALLAASSTSQATYDDINPFLFKAPIAPHIAAARKGIRLTVEQVKEKIETAISSIHADIYLIEGVGGWSVPLNTHELMSDLVKKLNLPVILVVNIKLGCLNHAILTTQSIERTSLTLMGWIANYTMPKTQITNENIKTLTQWIKAPLLGIVDHNEHHHSWVNSAVLCKEISPAENTII